MDLATPARALEEVVVTARRREESLQDAPISITAFSAADLDVRGVAIGVEHVKIIGGFFDRLPGFVDYQTRELAEAQLAEIALSLQALRSCVRPPTSWPI